MRNKFDIYVLLNITGTCLDQPTFAIHTNILYISVNNKETLMETDTCVEYMQNFTK